jgi:hypothetical protein
MNTNRTLREEIELAIYRYLNANPSVECRDFKCGSLGIAQVYWEDAGWEVSWAYPVPLPDEVIEDVTNHILNDNDDNRLNVWLTIT